MKRIVSICVVLALLFTLLTGCTGKADITSAKISEYKYSSMQAKGSISSTWTLGELVDENEYASLYFNEADCYIYVFDKRSGEVWGSNPTDDGDISAAEKSQFSLTTRTSDGTQNIYQSYTDSVAKNQVEYSIKDGVLSVVYTVGYDNKLLAKTPVGFTAERYGEILEKCDKSQSSLLKKRYKQKEDGGEYLRQENLTQNQTEKLAELFEEIGYTEDDLLKDNASIISSGESTQQSTFVITLNCSLDEDSLVADIDADAIESPEHEYIEKLEMLPYFGCQLQNTDSYIFIPDGSGALIDSSASSSSTGRYEAVVYGEDRNITVEKEFNDKYNVLLPVFGIKGEKSGCFAIIEDGKTIASVNAVKAGILSKYANVFSSFAIDTVQNLSVIGNSSSMYYAVSEESYSGKLTVRYILLEEKNNSYSGMANIYRDYMGDNEMLPKTEKKSDISFYLETVGSVKDETTFAGFVYETNLALTKYEDNISMLQELQDSGIKNVNLILNSWFNGGRDQKLADDFKLISQLGENKGFKQLADYCEESGISLYPSVMLNSFSESDGIFAGNKYATLDLAYNKSYLYSFDLVTGMKSDSVFAKSRIVLSPAHQKNVAESFLNKYLKKYSSGIAIADLSTTAYSDLNKSNMVLRTDALYNSANIIEAYSAKSDLMLTAPNDLTAKYASNFTNVPDSSSSYVYETKSVPFYQLVFHGVSEYSFDALNKSSDFNRSVLRCIEYGAAPKFTWIKSADTIAANPRYAELYYTNYNEWFNSAISAYNTINGIISKVSNAQMTEHSEIADNAFKVSYSNGCSVYINYNTTSVTADGISIDANSAMIKE